MSSKVKLFFLWIKDDYTKEYVLSLIVRTLIFNIIWSLLKKEETTIIVVSFDDRLLFFLVDRGEDKNMLTKEAIEKIEETAQ